MELPLGVCKDKDNSGVGPAGKSFEFEFVCVFENGWVRDGWACLSCCWESLGGEEDRLLRLLPFLRSLCLQIRQCTGERWLDVFDLLLGVVWGSRLGERKTAWYYSSALELSGSQSTNCTMRGCKVISEDRDGLSSTARPGRTFFGISLYRQDEIRSLLSPYSEDFR